VVIKKGEGTKLDFFQNLFNEAKGVWQDKLEDMERWYKQYKGDATVDSSNEQGLPAIKAKYVRNITYELIESQITSYIPTAKVNAGWWNEVAERNAKTVERYLASKRDDLPFEVMNDIDERYCYIYGGSVWLVEWDEAKKTHTTSGDITVTCLSPKQFVPQPYVYAVQDMEYCFVCFETTKEDLQRRYNVTIDTVEETENEVNPDERTATLIVCYYRNDDGKVCRYAWSADVELSDQEDFFRRRRATCRHCGKAEALCECDKPDIAQEDDEYETPDAPIALSDGSIIPPKSPKIENGQVVTEKQVMPVLDEAGAPMFENAGGIMIPMSTEIDVPVEEDTKLPYYYPDMLPIVIRKNTSEEGKLFGQSDCEFIRPQQQLINKIESRIAEKLIRAGSFPKVPEDYAGDIDNTIMEGAFRVGNDNNHLFGVVDMTPDISKDIAEAERVYEHAKRILGITDSFQGQHDSTAQSGIAKQLQIQQGAARLNSKRTMKNAAYAELDKIIFQFALAYADEPRNAAYRDATGRLQNSTFNRYDFYVQDDAGEYYVNDQYLFSADASTDSEQDRVFLWQEARLNFQSGAYGNPADPTTLLIFWQNLERAHYPHAHENVERIRAQIESAQRAQIEAQQAEIAAQQEALDDAEAQAVVSETANRDYEAFLTNQAKGGQVNGV
jgi:hypothetical protein